MQAIQQIGASLDGMANGRVPENLKHLDKIRTPEGCWQGGQVACHIRYHQGRLNPKCKICLEELDGKYLDDRKSKRRWVPVLGGQRASVSK
jgi:hypothetical protein